MLSAEEISVSFGGVRAVVEVSISVEAGAIVGLVGPNGSGKSTLLNAVCGLVPAQGRVVVDGRPIPLGRPSAIRRAGLVRTFQTPQVFPALTCLENAILADADLRGTSLFSALVARPVVRRREGLRWERGAAALERVGLTRSVHQPAQQLTYGQRRLLELARALQGAPRFILLDEPTAGLNDEETRQFAELLRGLNEDGVGLLVVDHKIDFLDALCDSLVVLELGRVIASGPPSEVWAHEHVIAAYLGIDDGDDDALG